MKNKKYIYLLAGVTVFVIASSLIFRTVRELYYSLDRDCYMPEHMVTVPGVGWSYSYDNYSVTEGCTREVAGGTDWVRLHIVLYGADSFTRSGFWRNAFDWSGNVKKFTFVATSSISVVNHNPTADYSNTTYVWIETKALNKRDNFKSEWRLFHLMPSESNNIFLPILEMTRKRDLQKDEIKWAESIIENIANDLQGRVPEARTCLRFGGSENIKVNALCKLNQSGAKNGIFFYPDESQSSSTDKNNGYGPSIIESEESNPDLKLPYVEL